jgi:hypothetical protein
MTEIVSTRVPEEMAKDIKKSKKKKRLMVPLWSENSWQRRLQTGKLKKH